VEIGKREKLLTDIIVIHQQIADSEPQSIYRLDLTEINALEDFEWTPLTEDISSSEDSSSSDFEPETLKLVLSKVKDASVSCTHTCNRKEHWTLTSDVDREKARFILKTVEFEYRSSR